jgi:uncharacterized phiE125 gp8 family phage protein
VSYTLTVVTPPATPLVTLADAKAMLLIDHTADDALISALIAAATVEAQGVAARSFVTQTWLLALDAWPDDGVVRLPRPPLQSVVSLIYFDADNVERTIAATDYIVIADTTPGLIVPAAGKAWPTDLRAVAPIRIRYTAGYGTAADVAVSAQGEIVQLVKLLIAVDYESREALSSQAATQRERVLNGCKRHWGWE